jgi:hypothetical protein
MNRSEVEIKLPSRVATSESAAEWFGSEGIQIANVDRTVPIPDLEWADDHEARFLHLAELEALNRLTSNERMELEVLNERRRALKNPRSGEELIWEYEQREVTSELVGALTRYVRFHKPSN